MEISALRQQILLAIDRARRAAAERRAVNDEAGREYGVFLEVVAIPLFRQATTILRAEGHVFSLFTPGGPGASVRLMSDKSAEDFIELVLDTSGPAPVVLGRSSRAWGKRTNVSEEALNASIPIREISEADVVRFLLRALEPFVAK